jgi:hypothetical protein
VGGLKFLFKIIGAPIFKISECGGTPKLLICIIKVLIRILDIYVVGVRVIHRRYQTQYKKVRLQVAGNPWPAQCIQ